MEKGDLLALEVLLSAHFLGYSRADSDQTRS